MIDLRAEPERVAAIAKALKHLPGDESDEESAEERERWAERLGAFYQRSRRAPPAENPAATKPRVPSLGDVSPALRFEFNTLSYLSIGLSLIALLAFAFLLFRPPKPEAELRALNEGQTQTRATLEQLAGQMGSLNRRAEDARQNELSRSLRLTYITLGALRAQAGPEIRVETEALQARFEEILDEMERGERAEKPQ